MDHWLPLKCGQMKNELFILISDSEQQLFKGVIVHGERYGLERQAFSTQHMNRGRIREHGYEIDRKDPDTWKGLVHFSHILHSLLLNRPSNAN